MHRDWAVGGRGGARPRKERRGVFASDGSAALRSRVAGPSMSVASQERTRVKSVVCRLMGVLRTPRACLAVSNLKVRKEGLLWLLGAAPELKGRILRILFVHPW